MSSDCVSVKKEVEWECAMETTELLYPGHEIKQELVLGPERLQPSDASIQQESSSVARQLTTGYCYVKLDRLPLGKDLVASLKQAEPNQYHLMQFVVCQFCDKFFKLEAHLKLHVMGHVRYLILNTDEFIASHFGYTNIEVETASCSSNLQSKPDLSDERLNAIKNHKESFICEINIDSPSELKQKQQEDVSDLNRNKIRTNYCAVCGTEFQATVRNFSKHLLAHIKEDPELKEVFKQQIAKQYCCQICGRQFKQSYLVRRHQERTHNIEPWPRLYSCDSCHKSYARKYDLDKHLNFQTELMGIVVCDVCGKHFSRSNCFARHRKTHNQENRELHTIKKNIYNRPDSGVSAESVCVNKVVQPVEPVKLEDVESVNFQESTLFSRLKFLSRTLSSNRVGKSQSDF